MGGAWLLPALLAAQPIGSAPAAPSWVHATDAPLPLLLEVPFVAQAPLLCGGAAVEMALRHQGARGVWARDFARLVREEEGGIRTDELARAVEGMGWRVSAGPSTGADLEAWLRAGRPVVVLLAEGGGRHHYVLVVGREEGGWVVHDPAVRPGVTVPPERFLERWGATGRWALVVLGQRGGSRASRDPAPAPPEGPRLAARGTPLGLASEAFLDGRWRDAAGLAERAAEASPDDSVAWRLLGTARYLDGDPVGALAAWNRVGSPATETLAISGLAHTRHPVVHGLMGLRAGGTLTADDLERARRRLALLPSAEATSLSYRTLPGGRVGVEAAVVERPLVPGGRMALAQILLSALASSDVEALLASPTGGGEALALAGRWAAARPAAWATVTAPGFLGLPGVARLRLSWEGERQRPPGAAEVLEEERSGARLELGHWASPWLFWQAGGGVDRWAGQGRQAVFEGAAEVHHDAARVRVGAEGAAATGAAPGWLRWGLEGLADLPGRGPWSGRLRVLAGGVGARAPWSLRPGAGAGPGREGLLRAHPLERDGALDGSLLGTGALNATVEVGRSVFESTPLGRLEVAAFLDALRIQRPSGEPGDATRNFLDAGAGLRARLPGGTLRLDAAIGGGGARALSLVWEPRRGPLR